MTYLISRDIIVQQVGGKLVVEDRYDNPTLSCDMWNYPSPYYLRFCETLRYFGGSHDITDTFLSDMIDFTATVGSGTQPMHAVGDTLVWSGNKWVPLAPFVLPSPTLDTIEMM